MSFRDDVRAALPEGAPSSPAGGTSSATEGIRRYLDTAARHSVAHLAPGTRLAALKKLLLRFFRVVSRDQTVCNTALVEAALGLAERVDRLEEKLASAESRSRRAEESSARLRDELLQQKRELAAERRISGAGEPRLPGSESRVAGPETGSPLAIRHSPSSLDPLYDSFEEEFRGSEVEIEAQQAEVVDWLLPLPLGADGRNLPVLDAGCGRGEFLRALAHRGISGFGVDTSAAMVARCREQGLPVRQASFEEALRSASEGCLGAVVAFQLVEHLPTSRLAGILRLAYEKLAPGGRLVLETINPESLYALSRFYLDLTHEKPIPAAALRHLMRGVGFGDVVVRYRSPVTPAERLDVRGDPNLARLDRFVFGDQDYAVVGTR